MLYVHRLKNALELISKMKHDNQFKIYLDLLNQINPNGIYDIYSELTKIINQNNVVFSSRIPGTYWTGKVYEQNKPSSFRRSKSSSSFFRAFINGCFYEKTDHWTIKRYNITKTKGFRSQGKIYRLIPDISIFNE